MADWELTATTIYCDDVDDEVTLIVSGDGTARCSGCQKYASPDKQTAKAIREKNNKLGKTIRCNEAECHRIVEYRDSLLKG
jgi:hypothetical protein